MASEILFGIDLEDVRDHVPGGHTYSERVPENTARYLEFLSARGLRATFFVVGRVAERYPELVREIAGAGHELACHTHDHVQLPRHTPESLYDDLSRNLEALHRCGAAAVSGFRAPTFSLTAETRWAYGVLKRLGFEYSSSVFPARNPLYGWPEFGEERREVDGIVELPLTLHPSPLRVPLAGGVHFRVLPYFFVHWGLRRRIQEGRPILTYFHPYDLDTGQERFMHPDLSGNRFYNALMYVGRSRLPRRLERLVSLGPVRSYADHLRGTAA